MPRGMTAWRNGTYGSGKVGLVNRLYGVSEAALEESDNPRQCGEKNAEPGAGLLAGIPPRISLISFRTLINLTSPSLDFFGTGIIMPIRQDR